MKKLLGILTLAVAMISCTDLSSDNPGPGGGSGSVLLLLKSIEIDDNLFLEHTYDDLNRLKTTTFGNDRVNEYNYDGDTTFFESRFIVDGDVISSRKYYPTGSNSGRRDTYNSDGQLEKYDVFNYDDNDCGYVSRVMFDAEDSFLGSWQVVYQGFKCDDVFTLVDPDGEIVQRDQHFRSSNPAHNSSAILDFFGVKTKFQTAEFSSVNEEGEVSPNSYISVFTFNDSEFPVTETRQYESGQTEERVYTYY